MLINDISVILRKQIRRSLNFEVTGGPVQIADLFFSVLLHFCISENDNKRQSKPSYSLSL